LTVERENFILLSMSSANAKQTAAASTTTVRAVARPRSGFNLNCVLPKQVLDELVRCEAESGIYRTRVAAKVLCKWAEQQQHERDTH
jgi:hypothetical protein